MAASLIGGRSTRDVESVLGHLLVLSGPVVGARSDLGLLIGLSVLAVAFLGAAAASERGRDPLPTAARIPAVIRVDGRALLGAVALPASVLLGVQEVAWIAAERPRAALVTAGCAWLLGALAMQFRTAKLRGRLTTLAGLLAVGAIGVAVPSSAALMVTTWSSAAIFAVGAIRARRWIQTIPAWTLGITAAVITAARFGVSRADLHVPLFVFAAVLVVIGAVGHQRGGDLRPWAYPPLALGLLGVPASMSFAIADERAVFGFAVAGFAVYAGLGWVLKTGGFTAVMALMIGFAYVDAFPDDPSPLGDPVLFLPLAAAFALGAAPLLSRSGSPGRIVAGSSLHAAWAVVLVLAGVIAEGTSDFPWIVAGAAALLGLTAAVQRSVVLLAAAMVALIWAGGAAGAGWLSGSLAISAAVTAIVATVRMDRLARITLAPLAALLAASSLAAFGAWRSWSGTEVVQWVGVAAGLCGATTLALFTRTEPPRLLLWRDPIHVLAHLGAVVATGVAAIEFDSMTAAQVVAGAAAGEAVLVGVLATLRRNAEAVWLSAGFAAAAAGFVGVGVDASAVTVVVSMGATAVGLAVVSSWILLGAESARLRLWGLPAFAGAHVAAVVAAVVALDQFEPASASLTTAAVLAGEAVLVGSLASIAPPDVYARTSSSLLGTAAVAVALNAIEGDAAFAAGLLTFASVGAILAIAGSEWRIRRGEWAEALLAAGLAASIVAPAWAWAHFGSDHGATVAALVISGAAVGAVALIEGVWRGLYVGIGEWVTALWLIAGGAVGDANAIVLPVAVLIVVVVEIERMIDVRLAQQQGDGSEPPPLHTVQSEDRRLALLAVENIAVLGALTTAAYPMYAGTSWPHLGLLVAEAGLIVAWAIATRVSRRLLLGTLGLAAAATMPIARAAVTWLQGGVGGGQMLAVAAIAAVLLIVVGSLMERGRAQLGLAVKRINQLLEDWQ